MGVRAVLAALPILIGNEFKKELFKIYLTDCLQGIVNNTQKFAGGVSIEKRYYDLINRKTDNRTGEEIAAEVIKEAGLKVVNKDGFI